MAEKAPIGIIVLLAGAVAVAIYFATTNTPGSTKPPSRQQKESQVAGMGVGSDMKMNYGTPLSMAPELHWWAPGFTEPGYLAEDHPVVPNRVRYPALPGGNISTVMHYGWSRFQDAPPANAEWFLNPPEAAIL